MQKSDVKDAGFSPRALAQAILIAASGRRYFFATPVAASQIQFGGSLTAGGQIYLLTDQFSSTTPHYVGSFDAFNFVVISGADKAPNGSGNILASSILVAKDANPAGTLYFYVTKTGLTTPYPSLAASSNFTENALPSGWSVVETTFADSSNNAFGMGTLLASVTLSGATASAASVSGTPFLASSLYSLTEMYQINFTGQPGSAVSSQVISVTGVPEASTWVMMLIGFAGLSFAGYRANRKVAPPGRETDLFVIAADHEARAGAVKELLQHRI